MGKFIKTIVKDEEARDKMLSGMNLLADAVGSTLGPRSRNVALDRVPDADLPPTVLRDGVSVARAINVKDYHEDMGVRLLKGASLKTNELAGDGTTLSTVLAQAIVNESYKQIVAGINPMLLKKDIEEALTKILKDLSELSIPVKEDDYKKVASISAGDEVIGEMIAEVIKKVGKDGVITVEEGKSFETTVEYKEGMHIDRGYLSPYFVTNQSTVEAVINDPFILLTDKKINYSHEIMPFLEKFVKAGHRNLVIFAGEVVEEGLATLIVNKVRGTMSIVAIQAPAFGDRRTDELEDIAAFTGGQVILNESGRDINAVEIEELGRAKKVIVDRDYTKIFEGSGSKERVSSRIKDLEGQRKIANTPFDEEIKQNRIANLSGKIAVINVGGRTEVEIGDKKERIIDALSSVKSAIEEGVVAGGEIALLHLADNCSNVVLQKALKMPFRKLIENSGLDYAVVRGKLVKYPQGIDVTDGKAKDMILSGIIDPCKVVRVALENAVSVATMAATTNFLITDLLEENK